MGHLVKIAGQKKMSGSMRKDSCTSGSIPGQVAGIAPKFAAWNGSVMDRLYST